MVHVKSSSVLSTVHVRSSGISSMVQVKVRVSQVQYIIGFKAFEVWNM